MSGRLSAVQRWALASLAAAGLAACQPKDDAPVQSAPDAEVAVLVEAVTLERPAGDGRIRLSGLVEFKRETALSFGAPGEIETVRVDQGDRVNAGQTLATLRRTQVGADAEESAIARRTAEQQLARTQTLFDKGFASQAALDNARLALERVRETAAIVAPASGVVLRRAAERGQIVSAGQAVIWLGEGGAGRIVRASATGEQAGLIMKGASAEVRIRSSALIPGRVERLAAKSDDQTGAFEVEIRLETSANLRSGEVAEVIVSAGPGAASRMEGFVIPALALIDARADQGMVYVIDETGAARRRLVETGGVVDEGVVILKGLDAGDRVVTRGAAMLREGDPVRLAAQ
jgi:RND family efflux transporter MFP subunit